MLKVGLADKTTRQFILENCQRSIMKKGCADREVKVYAAHLPPKCCFSEYFLALLDVLVIDFTGHSDEVEQVELTKHIAD